MFGLIMLAFGGGGGYYFLLTHPFLSFENALFN